MKKTDNRKNPWAGLSSYEDPLKGKHRLKFCGRDRETKDVTRLIDDNFFVTLYGKSGIGKTSLLNAGVFPALRREQYMPLSLRLGMADDKLAFQSIITQAIEHTIAEAGGDIQIINVIDQHDNIKATDYLWRWFACRRFTAANGQIVFPVLVFDQFEEVFRRPESRKKTEILLSQLNYLIDDSHALNDMVVEGEDYSYDFNFRFVLSIREDDLYRLEDSLDNCSLPALKRCRYRLRSLKEQDAESVILIPGEGLFKEEEKKQIADAVISKSRNEDKSISTNIVSLLCSLIYEEYIKSGADHVSLDLVNTFVNGNPFEQFYNKATQKLSNREKLYIEEKLVDSSGRRDSISKGDFCNHIKNDDTREKLVKGEYRILQETSTSSNDQNYRIELIHDRLAEVIKDRREARKYKNRKRSLILIKLFLLSLLWGFMLYVALYTNDKNRVFSDITEVTDNNWTTNDFSKDCNNIEYDNIIEKLSIIEKQHFRISSCNSLTFINIQHGSSTKAQDTIHIEINNCPLLKEIKFNNKYDNAHIIINNCPLLSHIYLSKEVRDIHLESNNESLTFDISDDNNYLEFRNGILWNKIKRTIEYAQSAAPNKVSFPSYLSDLSSIRYKDTQYHNANVRANNVDTTAHLSDTIRDEIVTEYHNINVEHLTIGKEVKEIRDEVFLGFKNLKTLVFEKESSLEKIGKYAFYGCTSLSSLELPEIREIGNEAFAYCTRLKKISIAYPLNLGERVFGYCNLLDSIELKKSGVYSFTYSTGCGYPFFECPNIRYIHTDSIGGSTDKEGVVYNIKGEPLFMTNKKRNTTQGNIHIVTDAAYNTDSHVTYISMTADAYMKARKELGMIIRGTKYNYVLLGERIDTCYLFTKKNNQIIDIPLFAKGHLEFIGSLDGIKKIRVPFRQPVRYLKEHGTHNSSQTRELIFDLPNSIKNNITLEVPKGCKKYYIGNPEFTAFKDIIEVEGTLNGLLWDVNNVITDMALRTFYTFKHNVILVVGIVLLIIIVVFTILIRVKKLHKNSSSNSKFKISHYAVFAIFMLLLYIPLYWILFVYSEKVLESVTIAVFISVAITITLSYSNVVFEKLTSLFSYLLYKIKSFKTILMAVLVVIIIILGMITISVSSNKDLNYIEEVMKEENEYEACKKLVEMIDKKIIIPQDSLWNFMLSKVKFYTPKETYPISNYNGHYFYGDSIRYELYKGHMYRVKYNEESLTTNTKYVQKKDGNKYKLYKIDDEKRERPCLALDCMSHNFSPNGKYMTASFGSSFLNKNDAYTLLYNIEDSITVIKRMKGYAKFANNHFLEIWQNDNHLITSINNPSKVLYAYNDDSYYSTRILEINDSSFFVVNTHYSYGRKFESYDTKGKKLNTLFVQKGTYDYINEDLHKIILQDSVSFAIYDLRNMKKEWEQSLKHNSFISFESNFLIVYHESDDSRWIINMANPQKGPEKIRTHFNSTKNGDYLYFKDGVLRNASDFQEVFRVPEGIVKECNFIHRMELNYSPVVYERWLGLDKYIYNIKAPNRKPFVLPYEIDNMKEGVILCHDKDNLMIYEIPTLRNLIMKCIYFNEEEKKKVLSIIKEE